MWCPVERDGDWCERDVGAPDDEHLFDGVGQRCNTANGVNVERCSFNASNSELDNGAVE